MKKSWLVFLRNCREWKGYGSVLVTWVHWAFSNNFEIMIPCYSLDFLEIEDENEFQQQVFDNFLNYFNKMEGSVLLALRSWSQDLKNKSINVNFWLISWTFQMGFVIIAISKYFLFSDHFQFLVRNCSWAQLIFSRDKRVRPVSEDAVWAFVRGSLGVSIFLLPPVIIFIWIF